MVLPPAAKGGAKEVAARAAALKDRLTPRVGSLRRRVVSRKVAGIGGPSAPSVVEVVANLNEEFAGVEVVRTTEGEAVVE
jgi:hypothetical protein